MASKSRNANFSQEEKLLLAELGKQYPDIENKGYDNVSLKRKQSSWEKVVQSFNAGNPDGNKRDMKAIQGCWKRMKLQTKKEFDEQRRESKKTGGGKAPASPNAISKLVADVIPASVNPLENQFDDDSVEHAASAVNSSVIDDTDEPGPGVQCSMPSTSSSHYRKKDNKAKKRDERIRCWVSEFAIFNYPLFYLFIS